MAAPLAASASSPARSEAWWMKPRSLSALRKSDLYVAMAATGGLCGAAFAARVRQAERNMHEGALMGKTMRALGLMSGTSMDGIDVALIETDGEEALVRGPAATF